MRLPPQPAQILLLLVTRAGDVITREEIQQVVWQGETTVDFDVGINRCIRSIRSALVDNADNPRYLETVPRVGYRFVAPVQVISPDESAAPPVSALPSLPVEPVAFTAVSTPAATAGLEPAAERKFRRKPAIFVALSVCVIAAVLFWGVSGRSHVTSKWQLTPLAVALGEQLTPSFSADGRQIAFTWSGENQDNFDIYVKLVNSSSPPLRLTTNSEIDYSPVWSPDGQWIAFCRGNDSETGAVWLISALGGAERKIVDLHEPGNPAVRALAWSRDSSNLVISGKIPGNEGTGLKLVDINTGHLRLVTFPPISEEDLFPSVSPDGRTIAFTRDAGRGVSSILLVSLDGRAPRAISLPPSKHIFNAKPTWTPDGSAVGFVSNYGGASQFWLSPAWNSGPARLISELGDNVQEAIISTSGQLIVGRHAENSNILSIDLRQISPNEQPKGRRLFASTRVEESPAIRPDGQQIAFASNRTGFEEIWTGRTDGSDIMQVTYLQNPVTGSPDWSPDGRRLVFDSREGDNPQLYVASADGGQATPLHTGKGLSVVPRWSHDGRYVYFSSDRTGRMEVWRLPLGAGVPEQVTKEGGFAASLSRDGQVLYYTAKNAPVSSLWMMRLATGDRFQVSSTVQRRGYVTSSNGVYFFVGSIGQRLSSLYFFDPISGEKTLVGRLEVGITNGITLAPDDHTLYYTQGQSGSQLFFLSDFWR